MEGDEGGVDKALKVALTWFEASKARERPVAGPGVPTRNSFGPLAGEPIHGEVFFGPSQCAGTIAKVRAVVVLIAKKVC
jgi:hypothetical protein